LLLGGFAIVYVAKDIQDGNEYALKRLYGSDKDECNNIIKEINIHKEVSGHVNIVQFLTASFIDRTKNSGRAEYLLVTELCKGGSLYDCLDQPLEPQTVLKIIYQASKAIAHLHSHGINHRDIKIENFLIGTDGILKLCDFGSATKESHEPDITWTTQQRNNLEEFLQKFTTPMYRAPEQLDTWNNYQIGVKTDIWALGCILFCLCYKKHPFEDGAKLRIINGNYSIPSDSRFICFNDIIKGCFVVDPSSRFDVSMVLERLGAISETKGWPLKGELGIKGKPLISPTNDVNPSASPAHQQNMPSRPPPPRPTSTPQVKPEMRQPPAVPQQQQQQQQPTPAGNGLFSSIKGNAGSFFKNLKDTSSKVMQTVQQTMAKGDTDLSYITQRIIVMPSPSEGIESAYKTNHIEDIKMFIDQRFQASKLSVYNLGPRCARLPPPVRTVECGFIYQPNPPKAPILMHMFALAEDMYGFLHNDSKNVIIIQSPDGGKGTAATMVCALMLYAQLIREPEDAMQMFAVKRIPPNMRPSELRYSYYMADVVRSHFPHYKPITLVSINFSPIPRMTKARDGCRLFIEVSANDRVAISTLQEYDRMRLYHASEGKANLPLNITLCGDITVTLYHARNAIAGIGRPQGIKICQLQFHSGFIPEEETLLSFNRSELDDIPDAEHVPNNFNLSLSVFVGDDERAPVSQPPWLSQKNRQRDPKLLFSSQLEYEENVDNFSKSSLWDFS
jgi:cyclin G-associated kinase